MEKAKNKIKAFYTKQKSSKKFKGKPLTTQKSGSRNVSQLPDSDTVVFQVDVHVGRDEISSPQKLFAGNDEREHQLPPHEPDDQIEELHEAPHVEDLQNDIPTPKKEAYQILRDEHISPTRHPRIAKELIALKTLSKQVAKAPKKVKKAILSPEGITKKNQMCLYIGKKCWNAQTEYFCSKKHKSIEGQAEERNESICT